MRVDLSIVLPSFQAAPLARRSVSRLRSALDKLSSRWEVVVVDDGGLDFKDRSWLDGERVRLVQLPFNQGKGAAVRAGVLSCRGDVRVFTDVDLPYGTSSLAPIMEYVLHRGFHVVVGDRTLSGSAYSQQVSVTRRMASSVFSQFVGRLVTGGFFDTQCGLKAFRGDVAEQLFRLIKLQRFAFDVELIYLALKHKLDIKRIPVRLEENSTSSVRLVRDSSRGFTDVLKIKYYQLSGAYRSTELEEIVARDYSAVAERLKGSGVAHESKVNGC